MVWHKYSNQKLPNAILFYRDGVSESQFAHVNEQEFPQIKEGCADAFKSLCQTNPELRKQASYDPKITLVVVGKRHQTRFFPPGNAHRSQTSKSGNFRPGLLVDSVICHPYYFDFYLQAHDSIKGTARSAHYRVLQNEMNFQAPDLQRLVNIKKLL